jgi:hypothetical protein
MTDKEKEILGTIMKCVLVFMKEEAKAEAQKK